MGRTHRIFLLCDEHLIFSIWLVTTYLIFIVSLSRSLCLINSSYRSNVSCVYIIHPMYPIHPIYCLTISYDSVLMSFYFALFCSILFRQSLVPQKGPHGIHIICSYNLMYAVVYTYNIYTYNIHTYVYIYIY